MRRNGDDDVTEKVKWDITDAKVNVAALLNDPRKVRRDYDLFTKTWGEGFRDPPPGSTIPEHYPLPQITIRNFSKYLGQTRDKFLRHQSQVLPTDQEKGDDSDLEESPRWQKDFTNSNNKRLPQNVGARSFAIQQHDSMKAAARNALSGIPKIFLLPSFQLEDEATFLAVVNLDERSGRSKNYSLDKTNNISSSKLLQEKLSHYLDIVEVAIVRQISARSDAFFDEMVSQENLNEHLKKMSTQVHSMREKMAVTKTKISHKLSKTLSLRSNLQNREELLKILHIMTTVHQAQPTIQLLLSTNEYSGAFDLIETTQQVLKHELAGIHCFRHLSSQLSEIEKVIGHMMKDELSRCIQSELQRPLNEGHSTLNPNHLISIALGLLRRKQLVFLEEFREGIKVSVKTAIKMTVMDAVTASQGQTTDSDCDDPTQNQVNGEDHSPQKRIETLADKMRTLEFHEWLVMLKTVFENLSIFLKRIKSFLTVIVTVVRMSSPRIENLSDFADDVTEDHTPENHHETVVTSQKQYSPTVINHNHVEDENFPMDDMDQYEKQLMEAASTESRKQQFVEHLKDSNPGGTEDADAPNEVDGSDEDSNAQSDSNLLLNKDEHDEMMLLICQSMIWAADFSHDRCAKLIIAKNKDSSLDKLASKQFLDYLQAVKSYVSDTEKILFENGGTNTFASDNDHFSDCLKSSFGSTIEGNSPLRGVLQSHVSQYIARFHEERRNKLSLIIDNETWKQAEVPSEISKMFREIFLFKNDESSSLKDDPASSWTLKINDTQFCVVGTVLLLFKMVADYIRCADDLPNSVPDLASRVSELLTFFNSRTCQLVLGAGALKTVGLKTISTKNLGLASRCLQLVLHLLPSLKQIFEAKMESKALFLLVKKHQKGLRQFDHVTKAYKDHVAEINSKLVSILDCVIESNITKWQVKAPMPSKEIRTICRQISKFHETICDLLPGQQIHDILLVTHRNFKLHLKVKVKQFDVRNDGGPKYGLVMSDIAFYQKNLQSLGICSVDDLNIDSVWQ